MLKFCYRIESESKTVAKVKVHAGDFRTGSDSTFNGSHFVMFLSGKAFPESISVSEIETLEIASEESVKRIGGTIGWGAVGGAILGPVGLLAGLLVGGKGKEVVFVCQFKDGRKMLATVDSKTYTKIQAAIMNQSKAPSPMMAKLEQAAEAKAATPRKELSAEQTASVIKTSVAVIAAFLALAALPTTTFGFIACALAALLIVPPIQKALADKSGQSQHIFTGVGVVLLLIGTGLLMT